MVENDKQFYRIAMCCDFFYPRLGGVEMHIWSLAQCLLQRGHKVIILTHSVTNSKQTNRPSQRVGIRYMTNGLKVYYLPMISIVDNIIYPTFIGGFALFRHIILREQIDLVHGHQATSSFMHQCLLQATTLPSTRTLYTDHSLFGFADIASVHLNKVLKFTLATVDHCIAVSHTCRENLVLRASLSPFQVSTIPNAVDTAKFQPCTESKDPNLITIVIISRLVYRKGIDLVAQAIPIVCRHTDNVQFIIGGDGPKRLLLEEMRESYRLHDRVELLGAVPHAQVPHVLRKGQIFLNSSLTESFCIAILEAASCGLFVVSTKVGGVAEVLPDDMIEFADAPTPEALAKALLNALPKIRTLDRMRSHTRVQGMYSWHNVAARTELVYDHLMQDQAKGQSMSLLQRFQKYRSVGPIAGLLACVIVAVLEIYAYILDQYWPREDIEIAVEWRNKSAEKIDGDEMKGGNVYTPSQTATNLL